jgi:hypothetical protein
MKTKLGARLPTIFVRQGQYAAEAAGNEIQPPPDACIDHIAEMCNFDLAQLLPAAPAPTLDSP